MKILQINAVYKTTSTGRIAKEMHDYFKSCGNESYVGYAIKNTEKKLDRNVFRIGNALDHKIHAIAYRLDHLQGLHSTYQTKRLLNKVASIKPDIVLTHNLHSNYLNVELFFSGLYEMGTPIVMALHDCWFMTGGCYHFTQNKCDRWLNGCRQCPCLGKAAERKFQLNYKLFERIRPTIVATSKWVEGVAKKSLLNATCDIRMIYDWIDSETFYPRNADQIRKKLGVGDRPLILGVATGWSPDKGQDEMIRAAKEIPEAAIVLVGRQAVKADYPKNVITIDFTDSKDELAELYSAADVLFNPSKQETFGLVSGESLSCGTPIVVNDTTSCPEFVTDKTGTVIRDGLSAAEAIRLTMARSKRIGRDVVRKHCRDFVEANFNMARNIDSYLKLFKEIIDSHKLLK